MTSESGDVSLPHSLTPDCLSNTKWVALKRSTDDQFYMDLGGYIYTYITHRCTCTHVTIINKEDESLFLEGVGSSVIWEGLEGCRGK